uniref:Yippee domain-containing protein n=1 Tax=Panagrellus redivivus TaxID=6233 RepID=A0A7E4UQL7_PANRE
MSKLTFTCGKCKKELYQFIDPEFQHLTGWKAHSWFLNFGTVELSDVCKYGTVQGKYPEEVFLSMRRQWLVHDKNSNLRQQFDYD